MKGIFRLLALRLSSFYRRMRRSHFHEPELTPPPKHLAHAVLSFIGFTGMLAWLIWQIPASGGVLCLLLLPLCVLWFFGCLVASVAFIARRQHRKWTTSGESHAVDYDARDC